MGSPCRTTFALRESMIGRTLHEGVRGLAAALDSECDKDTSVPAGWIAGELRKLLQAHPPAELPDATGGGDTLRASLESVLDGADQEGFETVSVDALRVLLSVQAARAATAATQPTIVERFVDAFKAAGVEADAIVRAATQPEAPSVQAGAPQFHDWQRGSTRLDYSTLQRTELRDWTCLHCGEVRSMGLSVEPREGACSVERLKAAQPEAPDWAPAANEATHPLTEPEAPQPKTAFPVSDGMRELVEQNARHGTRIQPAAPDAEVGA